MNKIELIKLENYLSNQFGSDFRVKLSKAKDSAEVYLHDEFIATIYKDEDDGERICDDQPGYDRSEILRADCG